RWMITPRSMRSVCMAIGGNTMHNAHNRWHNETDKFACALQIRAHQARSFHPDSSPLPVCHLNVNTAALFCKALSIEPGFNGTTDIPVALGATASECGRNAARATSCRRDRLGERMMGCGSEGQADADGND